MATVAFSRDMDLLAYYMQETGPKLAAELRDLGADEASVERILKDIELGQEEESRAHELTWPIWWDFAGYHGIAVDNPSPADVVAYVEALRRKLSVTQIRKAIEAIESTVFPGQGRDINSVVTPAFRYATDLYSSGELVKNRAKLTAANAAKPNQFPRIPMPDLLAGIDIDALRVVPELLDVKTDRLDEGRDAYAAYCSWVNQEHLDQGERLTVALWTLESALRQPQLEVCKQLEAAQIGFQLSQRESVWDGWFLARGQIVGAMNSGNPITEEAVASMRELVMRRQG